MPPGTRSDDPYVLDARGLRCPLPVLRTRDRLRALPPGSRLDVLADDPLALLDLRSFCAREGHPFLGHREEPGGVLRLSLCRGGDASTRRRSERG